MCFHFLTAELQQQKVPSYLLERENIWMSLKPLMLNHLSAVYQVWFSFAQYELTFENIMHIVNFQILVSLLNFIELHFELGKSDLSGLVRRIHEVVPKDQQPELLQRLSEGNFTPRIMYEQFQYIISMGPIGQVCSCLCLLELECLICHCCLYEFASRVV